jgi:hypothetical protein
MLEKILKILNFIVSVIPLVSKIASRTKILSDSLNKVDETKPIEKEKSWRDKL